MCTKIYSNNTESCLITSKKSLHVLYSRDYRGIWNNRLWKNLLKPEFPFNYFKYIAYVHLKKVVIKSII